MAWIESHSELARHPKLSRLARELGVKRPAAIGHLHLLWWWAMDYAPDGDLQRFEIGEIVEAVEWPRRTAPAFVAALQAAGFLTEDMQLHDWDQYGGKLHRRRSSDAQRKRNERRTSGGRPADAAQDVRAPENRTAYVEERRGEERTEEDRTEEESGGEGAPPPVPIRDQGFTEKYDAIMCRFSRKWQEDRGLCEEVAELCERFTADELAKAQDLAKRKHPGKPPWPRFLTEALREIYERREAAHAG